MALNKVYKKVIVEGLSIMFILLFTYAAVNKLQELETFQTQLAQFPFISEYADGLVWVVPGMLITVSIFFFFEKMKLIAFYSSFLMILFFTLYIIAVLNFAESIPCSCAGVFSSWSWTEHLYFNIGVLLLALVGIVLSYQLRKSKEELTTIQFNVES